MNASSETQVPGAKTKRMEAGDVLRHAHVPPLLPWTKGIRVDASAFSNPVSADTPKLTTFVRRGTVFCSLPWMCVVHDAVRKELTRHFFHVERVEFHILGCCGWSGHVRCVW